MKKRQFQWLKGSNAGNVETFVEVLRVKDVDYIIFESGKRVSTSLIGDFIAELAEDGTLYIDSKMFDATRVETSKSKLKSRQNQMPINEKRKSDSLNLTDIILSKLKTKSEYVKSVLNIPVLDVSVYEMLYDVYPDLLTDLTKIIIDNYINIDTISDSIKQTLTSFYNGDSDITSSSFINAEIETI